MKSTLPPSTTFLTQLAELKGLRPGSWYLLAAATSTALGYGHIWLPSIYRYAVTPTQLAAFTPKAPTPSADTPAEDIPTPSKLVVRRLKEALFKSTILIGVPRVIEASFALKTVTEGTPDFDTTFVRDGIDATAEGNLERGRVGLERVYRKQLGPIRQKMGEGMKEIQWMCENITYGIFLFPVSEDDPKAPLSFAETQMVSVACLVAQRAKREVLWHMRGALRSGLSAEEVEALQTAVELIAAELGVDVKTDMPRVLDVTEEDDPNDL